MIKMNYNTEFFKNLSPYILKYFKKEVEKGKLFFIEECQPINV